MNPHRDQPSASTSPESPSPDAHSLPDTPPGQRVLPPTLGLPETLTATLTDPDRPDHQQLAAARAWLQALDPAAWTHELARHARADPRLARALGEHAVAHPNGFDLLILSSGPSIRPHQPCYRLRLHLWDTAAPTTTEDVHNHAWSFCSRVLAGTLRFTTYHPNLPPARDLMSAGPGGDDRPETLFHHYGYRFGSDGDFRGQKSEQVRLTPGLDAELPAGTVYTFDRRVLHRVEPAARFVATLVITTAFRSAGSDIYTLTARERTGARIPTEPLGADAVQERLEHLAHHITTNLPDNAPDEPHVEIPREPTTTATGAR